MNDNYAQSRAINEINELFDNSEDSRLAKFLDKYGRKILFYILGLTFSLFYGMAAVWMFYIKCSQNTMIFIDILISALVALIPILKLYFNKAKSAFGKSRIFTNIMTGIGISLSIAGMVFMHDKIIHTWRIYGIGSSWYFMVYAIPLLSISVGILLAKSCSQSTELKLLDHIPGPGLSFLAGGGYTLISLICIYILPILGLAFSLVVLPIIGLFYVIKLNYKYIISNNGSIGMAVLMSFLAALAAFGGAYSMLVTLLNEFP